MERREEIYQISAVIKCIPCWWIFNSPNLQQIWVLTELTEPALPVFRLRAKEVHIWFCIIIRENSNTGKLAEPAKKSINHSVCVHKVIFSLNSSQYLQNNNNKNGFCFACSTVRLNTRQCQWMSKFTNIVTSYCKHLGQFPEFSNNWILKIWLQNQSNFDKIIWKWVR